MPDSTIKNIRFSKKSIDDKSDLGELNKYEEKIKELDKNLKKYEDKENDNPNIKRDSQLDSNFQDDIDDKLKYNLYNEYEKFQNDIDPIKNLDFINNNDYAFNLGDIHNNVNKKFLLNVSKNIPNNKINIFNESTNFSDIDKIHNIFMKKKKT